MGGRECSGKEVSQLAFGFKFLAYQDKSHVQGSFAPVQDTGHEITGLSSLPLQLDTNCLSICHSVSAQ